MGARPMSQREARRWRVQARRLEARVRFLEGTLEALTRGHRGWPGAGVALGSVRLAPDGDVSPMMRAVKLCDRAVVATLDVSDDSLLRLYVMPRVEVVP